METRFEVMKLQFQALREESLAKMKFAHELGYYKLLALGAILSVLVLGRADGARPGYEFLLFVTAILFPVFCDLALYFLSSAIIRIGQYIRECIEPNPQSYSGLEKFTFWETYIEIKGCRICYGLFEAVHPLITLTIQACGIFWLLNWTGNPQPGETQGMIHLREVLAHFGSIFVAAAMVIELTLLGFVLKRGNFSRDLENKWKDLQHKWQNIRGISER